MLSATAQYSCFEPMWAPRARAHGWPGILRPCSSDGSLENICFVTLKICIAKFPEHLGANVGGTLRGTALRGTDENKKLKSQKQNTVVVGQDVQTCRMGSPG